VSPIDEAELYTPGVSVRPPRSVAIGEVGPSPAALLYAVTRSVLACWTTASPPWFDPFTVSVAVPVIDVVGNVPMSPLRVVGPVLVIPAPAKTAKLPVVPSRTGVAAASAPVANATTPNVASSNNPNAGVAAEREPVAPSRYLDSFIFGPFLSLSFITNHDVALPTLRRP
jgi:hypothetical protein